MNKKRMNKGIWPLIAAVIIITLVVGVVAATTGILRTGNQAFIGFYHGILNIEMPCENDPYNPDCTCTIDRYKVKSGYRYYCIAQSPKASTDCDWCAGQCIEWKKVWEQYGDTVSYNEYCDPRTPVPGYSCVARISELGLLECASVPAIRPKDLIVFCSEEAIVEFVTEWQGTDVELVEFFRNGCPVGEPSPLDQCELQFSGCSATEEACGMGPEGEFSLVECRSACRDVTGKITGGRYLWNIWWNPETKAIIGQPSGGWHDTDCISGV